jgi:catechol 2,3-dioxygenase-like lactoylglutathione lyase family enzyme
MTNAPTSHVTGVDFVTVPSRDIEASLQFYGTVLGLPPVKLVSEVMDSGVCHQAIFLDPSGNSLAIHHRYAKD